MVKSEGERKALPPLFTFDSLWSSKWQTINGKWQMAKKSNNALTLDSLQAATPPT